MRLLAAILLSAPLLAQQSATQGSGSTPAPAPAAEQWITGSVDVGNRWITGIAGDFSTYRSVVNLGEGPKLLGLDLSLSNAAHKLFDKINVRANGWGGEPYNTAHLDAEREGAYRLSLDYRNIAYFNALPSFADPSLSAGFALNQNSYNLQRRVFSGQIDLIPNRRIVPYLGYDRDWDAGTAITDFVGSQNEYAVADILRSKTDNYRGGIRFELNRFHLTLEQGGTTFKDDQSLLFGPSTHYGDRTTPYLGKRLFLNSLIQAYGVRGNSIYSRALFTANPFSRLNVYGQFLYSQPNTDVNYNQTETGNLVSPLSSVAFINGQLTVLSTTAKQPHSSGSFGAELRVLPRLRVTESVMTDRYHVTSALLSEVDNLIPGGTSTLGPAGLPLLSVNYNRQEVDLFYDLTSKLTLRGGHRYVWGDAEVRASDLSQTGPQESGLLNMHVGLAGLSFRPSQKLRANFDFEASSADRNYFRISLQNYQKARMRASYQALRSLTLNASFSYLNNENPAAGFNNYNFQSRENSLSAYWTPWGGKRVSLLAEYTRSTLNSNIQYLIPNRLTATVSSYENNAHVGTALLDLGLPKLLKEDVKVSLGGSFLRSSGSRPMEYFQPVGKVALPLPRKSQLYAEWRYYGMTDLFYLYQAFRTHQFTVGLHISL